MSLITELLFSPDMMIACGAIAVAVAGILFTTLWIKFSGRKDSFAKHYSHDIGRPIDSTEEIWRIAHDRNEDIIANVLVLRSKKPIKATDVKNAMRLLTKRHPMLRMHLRKNQDGVYCFQKMDKVDVDMRQLDIKDWQNVMEESLLEKFDSENGPLWRVTFLPNARYKPATRGDVKDMTSYPNECICIFGFHHIIIDGPSFARMFAEFISYVNKLSNNEEPKVSSMALLPPFSVYIHEAVKSRWYHHLLAAAMDMLSLIPGFPAFMMVAVVGISGKGNVFTRKHGVEVQRNPQIQPRTKIIPLEFSKEETSSLLKKCKKHQTTVQGAVQTAGCVAMTSLLEENECEIECGITVNARRFFKSTVPNEYTGPYVTSIQCKNTVDTSLEHEKFWERAKSVSEDIHGRLKKNEHMEMALMFYCMAPVLRQYFSKSAKRDNEHGNRFRHLMVYTNLGYCKFLDGSPNDDVILRASFSCTAEHERGSIFANNIATFNDQLFWTVVYYSNITSEPTAQKYADLVKEAIFKAVKG